MQCLPPCVLVLAGLVPVAFGQGDGAGEDAGWRLGEIEIQTGDVYSDEAAGRFALRRLINATHWTTRRSVIEREIWKRPGDPVDAEFAAELERNLRASGLFGSVHVSLREAAGAPGVRDLVVITRDRLSLSGGASGSFVGNVASGGVSLSESNLLGFGDRLGFSFFENDFGESRGLVAYRDRYLAGTWTTATVSAGRTDEGDFYGATLERPFRYLADTFSWGLSARTAALDADYFLRNETVAEVPFDDTRVGGSATWRRGTRQRFFTYGWSAESVDRSYGAARGPAAAVIRVPGDTISTYAGGTLSFTDIAEFKKVMNLDTLRFVQDVQVGLSASVAAGATWRDESGGEARAQPTVRGSLRRVWAAGESRFASATAQGYARTVAGEAVGWNAELDLRAYEMSLQPHTFAVAVSYAEADETEDLPVQLTLGEGGGLRGYPRREFVGQRIVTLNFEDRIDLDARIGTLDFGAVLFADVGWIGGRASDLGDPLTSVGFGLRIGSTPLLGAGVLRLDVSFPLDDFQGESFDPLISLSLGQVFGL